MGSVWLARDKLLDREVALKELVRASTGAEREELRARALREARAMARVQHPAIVRIHDVFFSNGDPWIVMEYIRGQSLAERIAQKGSLDEQDIARIGLPVLRGLSAAHGANVVHRDVKPANILLADDGSIFLVDFGIAKIAGDTSLTVLRTVVGTTEYLAPERLVAGTPVGPAADLWSLGVTFFCALEGYSPFLRPGERSHETTSGAILHEDPPRLKNRGRLADVVVRLLNKDPAQRGDAQRLDEDLRAIIREPSAPEATPQRYTRQPPYQQAPQPADAMTGLRLEQVRRRVRDLGTDSGAEMLLSMPDEHAVQVLADYPAPVVGDLIQAMASTQFQTTVMILQTLSATAAGRAVDYLNPDTAASLLAAMPSSEAARILSRANVRTAASVLMTVSMAVSLRLIKVMQVKRARAVLEYVKPVTVAEMLGTMPNDLSAALLREFSESFRSQVVRHL